MGIYLGKQQSGNNRRAKTLQSHQTAPIVIKDRALQLRWRTRSCPNRPRLAEGERSDNVNATRKVSKPGNKTRSSR